MLNDYFNKIYCINLDRATERWRISNEQFNKYNIKVERFSAIEPLANGFYLTDNEHIYKGEVGVLRSNYEIIKRSKEENLENVLIFEDDFELEPNFDIKFNEYITQVPEDWDFLYFGAYHHELRPPIMITKNVARMTHSFCLHTFAVKHTMYDRILEIIKEEKRPVDVYYAFMMSSCNAYVFRPHLSNQLNGYSYIQNKIQNHDAWRK